MSNVRARIKKRRKAIETITEIAENTSHALVIHYSCESFYDIKDGRTPRVTSIAVRYLKNGQTKSFSIHKVAEREKVSVNDIEEHYDELEYAMLSEYFTFAREHKSYIWVHWNMRDINYGFEAIEHRFAVLGGVPESINDENKIDLARVLVNYFGLRYIEHPRLEKLVEKNGITKKDFLAGAEEARAFDNKEYVRLHQSTLRKVDIINTIVERTAEGSLKTNARFTDIYGLTPQGLFELAKDSWLISLIFCAIGLVVGALLSKILG